MILNRSVATSLCADIVVSDQGSGITEAQTE